MALSPAVGSWASYLSCLSLRFPSCEMGITTSALRGRSCRQQGASDQSGEGMFWGEAGGPETSSGPHSGEQSAQARPGVAWREPHAPQCQVRQAGGRPVR